MFVNPQEILMMRRDFEVLCSSPEANTIQVEYLRYATDPSDPLEKHADGVYGIDNREVSGPSLRSLRGIQKIVKIQDVQLTKTGLLKVGDCVFYLSNKIKLDQLEDGATIVKESLAFIDPEGTRWKAILDEGNEITKLLVRIGKYKIGQVVPCRLETRLVP